MRPIQSAVLLLAALLAAAPAHARGLNLSWSRCEGEAGSTQNQSFACDTNAGSEVLVGSFKLDNPLTQVSGNEIVIHLISQDDPLPAWWDMKNPGTCRPNSLTSNTVEDPSDVVCTDWARGNSTGGIASYSTGTPPSMGSIDPSLARRHRVCVMAIAVPPDQLVDLEPDIEYFSFNLVIDHAKTVGPGACGGCTGAVCLVFASINITTPVLGNNFYMSGGTTTGSDWARWQGNGADCALVPVKNKTWGEVKAMYR
jgi:hypothetical protein